MTIKLPKGYRVVPSHPDFAVTENGEVINVHTHYLLAPWKDSDGEENLVIYQFVSGQNRRTVVKVSDMVKEANDADRMLNRYTVTLYGHDPVIQSVSVHRDELGNFIKAIEWEHINTIKVEPIEVLAPWEVELLNGGKEEAETSMPSANEWRAIPGYPDVETDIYGNVRYTDDQTHVPAGGGSARGFVHYHLEDSEGKVSTYSRGTIVGMTFPEIRLKKD